MFFRSLIRASVCAFLFTSGLACRTGMSASSGSSADRPELLVMTFNIRYGTADDGENSWDKRKDLVFDLLRTNSPDVVGLQEALRSQIDDIRAALPEYAEIGGAPVLRVNRANRRHQALVQRLQQRIEFLITLERRNRFIEQIVTQHRRLVAIAGGNFAPDFDGAILAFGVFKQPRMAGAVVDALREGTRFEARYLGPLFSEERLEDVTRFPE